MLKGFFILAGLGENGPWGTGFFMDSLGYMSAYSASTMLYASIPTIASSIYKVSLLSDVAVTRSLKHVPKVEMILATLHSL